MQEGTIRAVGSLAGEKISDLDDTILVEKFGLKDLWGSRLDVWEVWMGRGHTFEEGR